MGEEDSCSGSEQRRVRPNTNVHFREGGSPDLGENFEFCFFPEARSHPQSGKAGKERPKELRKSKERGKDGYANVAED